MVIYWQPNLPTNISRSVHHCKETHSHVLVKFIDIPDVHWDQPRNIICSSFHFQHIRERILYLNRECQWHQQQFSPYNVIMTSLIWMLSSPITTSWLNKGIVNLTTRVKQSVLCKFKINIQVIEYSPFAFCLAWFPRSNTTRMVMHKLCWHLI
jgi:hypothetical protein